MFYECFVTSCMLINEIVHYVIIETYENIKILTKLFLT